MLKEILFIFLAFRVRLDGVSEEETESAPTKAEAAISEEEQKKFAESREKSEKHVYQSDVSQMMRIIVNNLYQRKDVFLRELISNAFDALDKLRFAAIKDSSILDVEPNLEIRIQVDPINRYLVISDTGIGMTQAELTQNLGTIARSGTKEFVQKLSTEQSSEKISDLTSQIGQFGVGFYSAFLVSDKVLVASKSASSEKQYIFEADTSSFNIYEDPRGNTIKRGTSIILYLNQDSSEFLKEDKIVGLIEKYSEFINFPIFVYTNLDDNRKEVPYYWRRVNDVAPIWMKPSSEISESEYEDFYNSIAYGRKKEQHAKPRGTIHFSAEGETNFKALLFIPDKLEEGYINSPLAWKPKINLYVRRVLITGETNKFLPHYLSYMVGIVDSEDLPLNVGREMPQHSELIKVINRKLTRKILDYIKKLANNNPEEYEKFYEDFGNSLKYGVMDDEANNIRIARLLRFYATFSRDKKISFEEYISKMKPGQPGIMFLSASDFDDADNSPYMELIKQKGWEVLYLFDNIDEAVMQNLRVVDGHALVNVAKEVQDIPQSKSEEEKLKDLEDKYKPLTQWLKKKYYKGKVALVKISQRLVKSSCILMAPEDGYTGSMDRVVRSQSYLSSKKASFDAVLNKPKNLELNPYHPLVKSMLEKVIEDSESNDLKEDADVCMTIGTLSGGYMLEDGVKVGQMMEKLYLKHLSMSVDEMDKIKEEYDNEFAEKEKEKLAAEKAEKEKKEKEEKERKEKEESEKENSEDKEDSNQKQAPLEENTEDIQEDKKDEL